MRSWVVAALIATAVVLPACGSSRSAAPTTTTVPTVRARPAGLNPSKSAQMICGHEVQTELDGVFGTKPLLVTPPTWADHLYSCNYVYANGTLSLSVKELDNAHQTTSYFNQLAQRLGRRPQALTLGQGAFVANDGSVVVRKDWKVLLVDVSKLPAQFGQPPLTPSDVGFSVSEIVMGCWSGA